MTTLTGLVLNAATDVKHWPWPFRVMQDDPWRWLVALTLVTVVLGALAWWVAIGMARAEEGGGAGGNEASTVTGNVVQIGEGAHGLVQIFTGRAGPAEHPRAKRQVSGLPAYVPEDLQNRDGEVAGALQRMARPDAVLVQLVGPDGIGKTAVAVEVVRQAPTHVEPVYLPVRAVAQLGAGDVLEGLAGAVADEKERRRVRQRMNALEASVLGRLDDVLAALGGRGVWLIVDDAQDLLCGDSGAFRDETVHTLITGLAARSGRHHVKVLLVSSKPLPFDHIDTQAIDHGLHGTDFEKFYAGLADEGLRPVPDLPVAKVAKATEGSPRTAELLLGIRQNPTVSGPDLLRRAGQPARLAEALLASLDSGPQRAIRTLAAVGRPLGPDAVAHLTDDVENEARSLLTGLAGRRLVREQDDHFYLPAADARHLADLLAAEVPPRARRQAAAYFAGCEPAGSEQIFQAVDLYLAAGDGADALRLIDTVTDEILLAAGGSSVLIPRLRTLIGLVNGLSEQVHIASLLARALAQQGDFEAAVFMVTQAGHWNEKSRRTRRQMELLIDLSGYYFRAGRLVDAEQAYRHVLARARAGRPGAAAALAGLALCQVATGAWTPALTNLDEAEADLATHGQNRHTDQRLAFEIRFLRAVISIETDTDQDAGQLVREVRQSLDKMSGAGPTERQVLAARADDLEAWTRLQNDDWRAARPLAEKAHDVAVQVGNADLYSGAGRTLAVIRLHRDEAAEAYEVASVAARYGMRLYQPELLAIAGVAALRCGNVGDRTRLAFTGAVGLAEDLLPGAPDAGLLYEARGLAFAGLALLDGSDEGEAEAAQAYGKAIELCGAAGARRRHELFHALVAKRPDALPVLRGLLG